MVMNEMVDFSGQVLDAPEGASSNRLLGDHVEPDLDLVQPGGVGRRQMDVKARMQGQPALHPGVFVGGIVVDDQMNIQILRDVSVNMLKEVEILLVTMPLLALAEDLARSDIQRGKECHGPVPDIVVGHTLHVAQSHGQNGLSPVQGLNLAFLIDTEDQGIFRRIQIQADDIPDLLDEKGVGRDLEMALPVRLQAEGIPDSLDRRSRNGCFFGHRADRPVGTALGLALECFPDELRDLLIGDGAGTSGTQLIMQAGDSLFPITFPPQGYGLGAVVDLGRDITIAQALGRHEDDLCPCDQAIRQGPRTGDDTQFQFLFPGKHDRLSWPSCSHGLPPSGQAHDNSKLLYSQVI